MTSFAADLLAVWLVVTAACSGLLLLVMAVQGAVARARRRRAVRRRHSRRGQPGRRESRRGDSQRGTRPTGLRTSTPVRR